MDTLLQDLRFGVRMLLKNPGFTLAAIVALALGIGANTAIFSVVNAVLLRPLQYPNADRVMMVWESNPSRGWDKFTVSPANFLSWSEETRSFAALAALRDTSFVLTGQAEPERLSGLRATSQFFDVIRTQPALGRPFLPEEYAPGKDRAVILSDALWKRRFGGRPEILGAPVTLSAEGYTVVGVMPEGFRLPSGAETLAPLAFAADEAQNRGGHNLVAMARLESGVDVAAAATEMRDLASRLEKDFPDTNTGWTVKVVPLFEEVVGEVRPALLALFAAVGFVLLIACANVANLMLVRAAARRGEIAVRTALGAGRTRLLRQLLTESLLLALLGGCLGLLLGLWSVDLLKALQPGNIPRLGSLAIDRSVLIFTFGVSLATGIVFGIVPALLLSRAPLLSNIKEAGRAVRGQITARIRGTLVVAQVALSLVLLVGAGLQIRSFEQLLRVDPGFDPRGVLAFRLSLPDKKYPGMTEQTAFYDRVLASVAGLPGVSSAAAVSVVPLSDRDLIFSVEVEGRPSPPPSEHVSANWYSASPDYFATLRIPLRRGRLFTEHDAAGAPRVMLINESFARRIFPGADPIGQRVRMGIDSDVAREIVGVVGDVRHYGLDRDVTMQMYEPAAQRPWPTMTVLLRTTSDPASLAPAARRAVLAADPEQPVSEVGTVAEMVAGTTAQRRFSLLLLSVFAGVALLLAAVGIYGVVAYSVAQRNHEIGVRMALGASRREILGLVLRQGMGLALGGVATGLLGALALTRLVRSLLFGISPTDPLTFAVTALVLSTVTLVATYIPARRATRVEPTVALRYE